MHDRVYQSPYNTDWPHSRALGERWFARPLNVPADQSWPGVHWFATEQEAREFGDDHA
jgi:hypothetical protein